MANKIAGYVAGGLMAAAAVGFSYATDDGIKSCTPDGDGGVTLNYKDGSKKEGLYSWTVSGDGTQCLAKQGGSAPPITVPVVKGP